MKSLSGSLSRWRQDRAARLRELVAVVLVLGVVYGLLWVFDPGPGLARLLLSYPHWHLGALLGCLMLAAPLLAIYAWLRWIEVDQVLASTEIDLLTGVHNRRHMESLLEQEFDRALRYGRPLALLLFDIDGLGALNAQHGELAGDAVLVSVVRRISRRQRATDHFGRWQGGCFMLICPETSLEGAARMAERMRRTVCQQPLKAVSAVVTASFGISAYYGQGDYEALVDEAEHYMRVAKDAGRDRVMSRSLAAAQFDEGGAALHAGGKPTLTTQLSTLMETIVAPIKRRRRSR